MQSLFNAIHASFQHTNFIIFVKPAVHLVETIRCHPRKTFDFFGDVILYSL